ncbi:putative glycerol uptake facilitator protein [Clostridium pasteurianum DSM 525 = ATCC 6013]|uniref:MIP family channel protein n=1 Tax=Clostridium pasteurianum DSM 525 = ATCC 6013 TaxID=1262449 RepID=A0A0H3J3C5_CLOPA|nr:MIP/aquaporin family protein [Clostridium pasteurianum]AJA47317.1 putative glycerol uptake facilitator protein [Clostridium pasteurianum DSM 525 = ATCC 6013]AJA51305.1 putative glycerol uptake facilitator protein [Clostridium pasteurianum DSM 525 = ATCC 6013]AOZ74655.1 glycerol transporter [Clostridium pasteurianum DSM 525 = ATCC 6013]AOZ78452.1 glycerol transporter [Clostridium pasteurianum]ELP58654.1 glycerol uptake facilitator protein [Clostridium pasteurianum DSM 525 = ATCC 6013]
MEGFVSEMLGTMILIILGDGVVANVVLKKTKAENSGWMVISTGWALAVTIPVFIFGNISGAHFNPAVTIGMAFIGSFPWSNVGIYIAAQLIGAFLGAIIVWIYYRPHFNATEDKEAKLAVFCTQPAIRDIYSNFICEFIGTFILVFAILGVGNTKMINGLSPIVVGGIIWAIGLTLGGTTGYAINPVRDLGPRIAHYILPIKDKGSSDWKYALIPVAAPICGGIVGALLYKLIF